ncbi:glycosyltransferase [Hymenobacter sp. BT507]|uniref:Glycosyltransferase n=1 Tax=Hymenobacter citatus TaxID=2763506 RepID=A0ABR7MH97_9BACT|nr:glycosyltransferase [Hymenobacter citatus]
MNESLPPVALPVVSVIIPCYNQAHFLGKALASVQQQSYPAVEIVLVDDGSTDNTRAVALAYEPALRYVYQDNQGLSAARNTGIRHSTGTYLVFLDADDWLYPQALALNVAHLQRHPHAAFVSGAFMCVFTGENIISLVTRTIEADHYLHLLRGNYLGMPAVALYQRWVFDDFLYDTELNICSDYDLCLRVARHHPVLHHTQPVAAYRQHNSNMSGNIIPMLNAVLQTLYQHKPQLRTPAEKRAYQDGIRNWKKYYATGLYNRLRDRQLALSVPIARTLLKHHPFSLLKFFVATLYRPKLAPTPLS